MLSFRLIGEAVPNTGNGEDKAPIFGNRFDLLRADTKAAFLLGAYRAQIDFTYLPTLSFTMYRYTSSEMSECPGSERNLFPL